MTEKRINEMLNGSDKDDLIKAYTNLMYTLPSVEIACNFIKSFDDLKSKSPEELMLFIDKWKKSNNIVSLSNGHYSGSLIITSNDEDSWSGIINDVVVRNNEIVFSYHGNDADFGPFEGGASLNKSHTPGIIYEGGGTWLHTQYTPSNASTIQIQISKISNDEHDDIVLNGYWLDSTGRYKIQIDLSLTE